MEAAVEVTTLSLTFREVCHAGECTLWVPISTGEGVNHLDLESSWHPMGFLLDEDMVDSHCKDMGAQQG